MQKGNREVIENKIKEHFMKIRKVVEGYEQKMMLRLDEIVQEQSVKIANVQS